MTALWSAKHEYRIVTPMHFAKIKQGLDFVKTQNLKTFSFLYSKSKQGSGIVHNFLPTTCAW